MTKKTKKRITLPDDLDRLAENLYNVSGRKINDRNSFDREFNKFFEGNVTPSLKKVRDETFKLVQSNHPDEVSRRPVLKKNVEGTLKQKEKDIFRFVGLQSQRVVFARQVFVKIKGVNHRRFRGKDGRFVRVST